MEAGPYRRRAADAVPSHPRLRGGGEMVVLESTDSTQYPHTDELELRGVGDGVVCAALCCASLGLHRVRH